MKCFKGLLALGMLWLLPSLCIFTFDSCKKANYDSSPQGEAARKFIDALNTARSKVGSITLENSTSRIANPLFRTAEADGTYYLDYPDGSNPGTIGDIQSLTNVLKNGDVAIDNVITPTTDIAFSVPDNDIRLALAPLVVEARNYLATKGITEEQVTTMLQEEGAEEINLIPFVRLLTAAEQQQYGVRDISLPFVNTVSAGFLSCGVAALGGDALYALAFSGAGSWSFATMRGVFAGVAKRFLGPIGVAIAVVSFSVCMLQ